MHVCITLQSYIYSSCEEIYNVSAGNYIKVLNEVIYKKVSFIQNSLIFFNILEVFSTFKKIAKSTASVAYFNK